MDEFSKADTKVLDEFIEERKKLFDIGSRILELLGPCLRGEHEEFLLFEESHDVDVKYCVRCGFGLLMRKHRGSDGTYSSILVPRFLDALREIIEKLTGDVP